MATKSKFSIKDAVSYGWKMAKKRWGFLVLCILIIAAVQFAPDIVSIPFAEDDFVPRIAIVIVGIILQMAVSLGIIGIALKLHDGKKAAYSDLFGYFDRIIPYFLASIVYTIIVIVGLILLIVPGIIWSIKYRYYPYLIIDKKMGPMKAIKASGKITNGSKWKIFFLGVVLGLINLVGFLLLLVGLLFTIPLTIMAEVYVYRKLAGK